MGNREGSQFDRLGQAVRRLLDALVSHSTRSSSSSSVAHNLHRRLGHGSCVSTYGQHADSCAGVLPASTSCGECRRCMPFSTASAVVYVCCRVQGVPCVQAVGEAEAMCAALNVCGWAHAVHTADVDALLFGTLTVYSKMHLQAGHLAGSRQPHMLHFQL